MHQCSSVETKPNTPHISSSLYPCQRAHQRQKRTKTPESVPDRSSAPMSRPRASAPPVRGYLRMSGVTRKREFPEIRRFFPFIACDVAAPTRYGCHFPCFKGHRGRLPFPPAPGFTQNPAAPGESAQEGWPPFKRTRRRDAGFWGNPGGARRGQVGKAAAP